MDRPAVFSSEGFAAGMQQAIAAGRWLIVDAAAKWCQPCKQMDATTWVDGAVVAWLAAHAVAVQVDVEEETEVAGALAVGAMPTVIAYRDGVEKDRVVGFRAPPALLAWFAGLERGETSLEQQRRALADPEHDMMGRLALARALMHGGRHEEATGEYLWLWANMARVDPAMIGVRLSFMAAEMGNLVRHHPAARERFSALREEAAAASREDWMVLNEVLGDEERTLAWFDGVKDDPAAAPVLERVAHGLERLLSARKRWADIGRLYRDPVATLARSLEMAGMEEGIPPEMVAQMRAMMAEHVRGQAALLYGCLLAAGRSDDAAAVEREAARHDPSEAMAAALRAAAVDCR